jgi:hypothetical protein
MMLPGPMIVPSQRNPDKRSAIGWHNLLRSLGVTMSSNLEVLQEEVLHLPPADRARLLDRLIISLDVDVQAEAAWDWLAQERELELASGTAQAVPIDVAVARLETRFPG